MAVSKRLRYEILRRDNHTCRYCGRTSVETRLTVDHVVPTALGGSDEPSNLVTACADCNAGKSASSPDAAIVSDVAEDALRWATALKAVADEAVADLAARQAHRDAFLSRWNAWSFGGKGLKVPLPAGWERSVDNFLAAGLPLPLLLESIETAMSASKVSAEQTFRYMCGIAWSRIREMHDSAREVVGADEPQSGGSLDAETLVAHLWGALPYEVNNTTVEKWAARFRHDQEDDDLNQFADWPDEVCAFAQAVTELQEEFHAVDIAGRMLRKMPDAMRGAWRDEARRVFLEHDPDGMTQNAVDRLAVMLAFDHFVGGVS